VGAIPTNSFYPAFVLLVFASIDLYGFSGLLIGIWSDSKTVALLGA
jgi:hypothetical protein